MPNENGSFTPEEVAALKAQLEEEVAAAKAAALSDKAAALSESKGLLEEAVTTRDEKIASLEAALTAHIVTLSETNVALSEAKGLIREKEAQLGSLTELTAERDSLKTQLGVSIDTYRQAVVKANPNIPDDLIAGSTIEEVHASVDKARTLVEKIKASIAAQTQSTPVPAGAPPRTGVEVEAMSPVEKIKYGLRR